MIEADVRRTADGVLVLLHDETLDRTTTGTGPVAARSLADLRRLDAGCWFSPDHAGERVPTLDELFDLAIESGIALCLESKGESTTEQQAVAIAVASEVAARARLDVDVLASFDHGALAAAGTAVEGIRLAPDRLPERGPSSVDAILDQVRRCGARIVQHHHADLRQEVVDGVRAAGVEVWAWPPTTAEEVDAVLALGVDAVMGDDVGLAVERVAALR